MYQVSAQGVDENMLNVHYYYVLGKVLSVGLLGSTRRPY